MPDYVVSAAFTGEPDAAMLSAERERLKELADGGVLLAAYLSADLSAAWLVIRGDGPEDARSVVGSLPLYPYMEIKDTLEVQQIPLELEA